MKRLLLALILISSFAYGQQSNTTNTKFTNGLAVPNGVAQKPTSGITTGALSYVDGVGLYVYNGATWVLLGLNGAGVTLFNSRTGAITPLVGDYPFFPLYDGTGATGTWGIGISGNSATTTNGVYTNGSYANPSWITSLAWSKITSTPTTLSGYGITDAVPSSRTLTINGTAQDLSVNRTWTVTASTTNALTAGYGLSGSTFDGSVARTWTGDTTSATGLVSKSRLAAYTYTKAQSDARFAPISVAGSVTTVSVTTANGVSGSVANPTTTPAITLTLGAITPTSTNGVSAATMAFNDATSSIQTQLNGKQAAYAGLQDSITKKANRTFDNVATGAIPNAKLANISSANVASAIVQRNGSGGFIAGEISTEGNLQTLLGMIHYLYNSDNSTYYGLRNNAGVLTWSYNGADKTTMSNTGSITAPSFVKSGGTSSQFLLGDGSVTTTIPNSSTTATSANVASAIVTRDGSGNFIAGTITANLTGTASSATTATTATNVALGGITGLGTGVPAALAINTGSAGSFIVNGGNAGTPSAIVLTNGTGTASGLTAGAISSQANSATITASSTNVASNIVQRDGSGNFIAGTITANLTGNASTSTLASTVTTNANLTGDVTSVGNATTLASVNSNVGSFGSSTSIPTFTVNAKGLITAASGNVVIAPAGTLTGTTLASNVVTSSLTTVGTIASGTWSGSFGAVSGANLTNLTAANISSGTAGINISGNSATVTTNANLTGPITSSGNATAIASQTGTGTKFVMDTSPTLVTPNIGVATGTSLTVTKANDAATVLRSGASGSFVFLDLGRTSIELTAGVAASAGQFATNAVAGDGVINSGAGNVILSTGSNPGITINTSQKVIFNSVPTTSAGTYDILTRNTSTGVLEKVSSSVFGAYPTTVLFTNTASRTIANSAAETSIIASNTGTQTIAANALTQGKQLRITAGGVYSTPAISAGTLTIKVKLGSTVIATGTASGLLVSATNAAWSAIVKINTLTTGSSGTVVVDGSVLYSVGNNLARLTLDLNNSGSTTTINTTTSQVLDVTATWDTADASKSLKINTVAAEVLTSYDNP